MVVEFTSTENSAFVHHINYHFLIFVLFVLLYLNPFISLYQNGCFLFIFCQFKAEIILHAITAFFFTFSAAFDRPMMKFCEYRGTIGTSFSRTLIKIPPCSKALSAEHRLKFCSPSPVMVTSPYK